MLKAQTMLNEVSLFVLEQVEGYFYPPPPQTNTTVGGETPTFLANVVVLPCNGRYYRTSPNRTERLEQTH